MLKARYYKADGKKGRARPLPVSLFDGVVHEGVLHQVVKAYLANQRQGTAAAKNRAAVSGGSRKPWRQKGTGRARQGTIRAVQWEGGGRAFPPIPHSWRQRIPRKVKALARRSAFNARAEEDQVILVDLPTLEAPRTREVTALLKALELDETRVLFLTHGINRTFHLSTRNLQNVEVRPFGEESPYDVLRAEVVLIERAAIDEMQAASEEDETEPDVTEPVSEVVSDEASDEDVTDEDASDA